MTGEWRKLYNEELNDLHCSPNIVWVIKSRRMTWEGHVPRMGGEERRKQGFGGENLREREHLGDPGEDVRVILRWIFMKLDVGLWIESICLRIWTGAGHLWLR